MKRIATFTGASGTGKTTLIGMLRRRFPEMRQFTNYTTRSPRQSDEAGEYEYLTHEQFARYEQAGELVWSLEHTGNRYGLARSRLYGILEDPTAYGVMHFSLPPAATLHEILLTRKEWLADVAMFYLESPTPDIVRQRLTARGDTFDQIERRLATEARWPEWARSLNVPFYYVPSELTLDEAFQYVLDSLSQS